MKKPYKIQDAINLTTELLKKNVVERFILNALVSDGFDYKTAKKIISWGILAKNKN